MSISNPPPPLLPLLPAVTHSRYHAREELRRALDVDVAARVGPDAYLLPTTPAGTWKRRREVSLARCVAACDRLGPDVVLSHVSAAILYGLWVPNAEWPVHTTQQFRAGSPRQVDEHVRHCRPLTADEVVETPAGLRITSLERTIVDTITMLSPDWALAVADSAMRLVLGPTRSDKNGERDLLRREWSVVLEERGPRRGRRHARAVLAIADHRSESPLESRMRCAVVRAGLPTPALQVEVVTHLGDRYVDLGWWLTSPDGTRRFVGFEVDGDVKYDEADSESARNAVAAEKRREDAIRESIRSEGCEVTMLRSSDDIEHDVDRLARALDPSGRMTRIPNLDLLSTRAYSILKQQARSRP